MFYAVLAIDYRFRLVSLTPAFSCIKSASDGRDRKSLYSAFIAASVLQVHIPEDVQKLLNDPLAAPIPTRARHFPAVSRLSKYPRSLGDYLTFEFLDGYTQHPLLYAATIPRPDEIIFIKFARRYSIELHDFCPKAGHAPSIRGYERLPGGWFVVAMEFVEPPTTIKRSSLLTFHRDRWIEELERLVDNFHALDLVHGDLWDADIIRKEDTMMLVDFDWGCKVGEVSYPTLVELNLELLEGRLSDDLIITKEEDRRVLRITPGKLK